MTDVLKIVTFLLSCFGFYIAFCIAYAYLLPKDSVRAESAMVHSIVCFGMAGPAATLAYATIYILYIGI